MSQTCGPIGPSAHLRVSSLRFSVSSSVLSSRTLLGPHPLVPLIAPQPPHTGPLIPRLGLSPESTDGNPSIPPVYADFFGTNCTRYSRDNEKVLSLSLYPLFFLCLSLFAFGGTRGIRAGALCRPPLSRGNLETFAETAGSLAFFVPRALKISLRGRYVNNECPSRDGRLAAVRGDFRDALILRQTRPLARGRVFQSDNAGGTGLREGGRKRGFFNCVSHSRAMN